MRREPLVLFIVIAALYSSTALSHPKSRDGLGTKEARVLISHIGGASLSRKSIVIKEITAVDSAKPLVIAEIKLVFRLEGDNDQKWMVAEIRTGDNRWEDAGTPPAKKGSPNASAPCEPPAVGTGDSNKQKVEDAETKQKARCAIARFLNEGQSSNSIKVNSVSPLEVPFGSTTSAVVEAQVRFEFAFDRISNGTWRISELRIGSGNWIEVSSILQSLGGRKMSRARVDMQHIADALDGFRRDRGFYVVTDSEAILIDHLSPLYLKTVIRMDPWHHAYEYRGAADHFVLRSAGPDGKFNTEDDLVVKSAGGLEAP